MPSQVSGLPAAVAVINDNTAQGLVNPVKASTNVEYVRDELAERLPIYARIRDAVKGQAAVKEKGVVYLPMPDEGGIDQTRNLKRYAAYLLRAVFYNVTGRTLQGLTGQVSLKPATIKVPPVLDGVVKDATGTGISLEQLGIQGVNETLQTGRIGLYTDYPVRNGEATTVAEQKAGDVKPTITLYAAEDCINWRVISRGAKSVLSLVVLRETYDYSDDGYRTEKKNQYRVLRLEEDGKYSVELWKNEGTWQAETKIYPTDGKGKPLTEIPFVFVGSQNNEVGIDPAPLEDLAELNIAHYRNSADYEEGIFITGQPTPVVTGIDQAWWENVLNKELRFGSRSGIPLPSGATFELVSCDPNLAALEAMKHKEEQMKALGAKLVEVSKVQRTATESTQDEISETSALSRLVNNVSAGMLWSLEWAAIFAGVTTINRDEKDADKKLVNFVLNTDFDFNNMSAEEINAAISAWQQGAISFTEMRTSIRKSGLASQNDDEAMKDIRDEKMENIKLFGDPTNPDNPVAFGGNASTQNADNPPADDEDEL